MTAGKGEPFQLIDVREPHEYDIVILAGVDPAGDGRVNATGSDRDRKVVVHCKVGGRAPRLRELEEKFGIRIFII